MYTFQASCRGEEAFLRCAGECFRAWGGIWPQYWGSRRQEGRTWESGTEHRSGDRGMTTDFPVALFLP